MSQIQFPISELQARQVPIQWHEAVAVVLEVAEWCERGLTNGGVPGVSDLSLTDDGRLLLRTTAQRTAEPVPALARLLDGLLKDAPAPQELRLLAHQDETSSRVHANVGEFRRALAFFARPDRATDLLALAERAIVELERTHSDREMQRLRAKVRETAPKAQATERKTRLSVRQVVSGFGAMAAVASVGFTLWIYQGPIQGRVDVWTESAYQRWSGFKVKDDVGGVPVPEAANNTRRAALPTPVQTRAVSKVGSDVTRIGSGRSATGAEAPGGARGPGVSGQDASEVGPAANARADAQADADEPSRTSAVVPPTPNPSEPYYGRLDTDVVPARLLRPQVPTTSGSPPAGTEVEVTIDETGRVESVRWVQFDDDFRSRMMASAIKAWRFSPATRNGIPVKYLARIRLQ